MDKLNIRFSHVKNNRLLNRVQMIVDVFHPRELKVTKEMIREAIKNKFKKPNILLVNVKKLFGGGRTKGFALVYDNEESMKKIEHARRLDREAKEKLPPKERKKGGKKKDGRKTKKVRKHQTQKKRGTKRRQDKNLEKKQAKKKK